MTNSHEADINYNGRIQLYILIWLIATAVEYHVFIVVIILETGRLKPVDHSFKQRFIYEPKHEKTLCVFNVRVKSAPLIVGNCIDV